MERLKILPQEELKEAVALGAIILGVIHRKAIAQIISQAAALPFSDFNVSFSEGDKK